MRATTEYQWNKNRHFYDFHVCWPMLIFISCLTNLQNPQSRAIAKATKGWKEDPDIRGQRRSPFWNYWSILSTSLICKHSEFRSLLIFLLVHHMVISVFLPSSWSSGERVRTKRERIYCCLIQIDSNWFKLIQTSSNLCWFAAQLLAPVSSSSFVLSFQKQYRGRSNIRWQGGWRGKSEWGRILSSEQPSPKQRDPEDPLCAPPPPRLPFASALNRRQTRSVKTLSMSDLGWWQPLEIEPERRRCPTWGSASSPARREDQLGEMSGWVLWSAREVWRLHVQISWLALTRFIFSLPVWDMGNAT